MTNEAQHAIRAAKHRKSWGAFAARRYCERRGVPMGLYRLACQLEAVSELDKTVADAFTFGSGFLLVGEGMMRHVPVAGMYFDPRVTGVSA